MTTPYRRQHVLGDRALPRWTHPVAWWAWALSLAVVVGRTTNPLLLALVVAVAGWVVARRRPNAPWARSFSVFLRLGLVVIAIRLAFAVVFGAGSGSTVLFTLPSLPLPEWAAGVAIGGPVTLEELLAALYQGMALAALLACFGAAGSLASPARLLASVPAALYEVGVAVVVALTFAPQLVQDVGRVRQARRLRGRPDTGVRALAGSVMPVLEGALERAVDLAAAMDSRGYGRTGAVPRRVRRTSSALLLVGMLGTCAGTYALLDAGTPGSLAVPMLAIGALSATAGVALAGRRSVRTRYRPDPWALPEWLVAGSGVVAAVVAVGVSLVDPAALVGPVDPPAWPALPLLPAAAVLLAALPGVVAPPPPGMITVASMTATADRRTREPEGVAA